MTYLRQETITQPRTSPNYKDADMKAKHHIPDGMHAVTPAPGLRLNRRP